MCSRYIKKQSDITEKPPKIKKTKTIQMKYPAPYSQSWSGSPQTKKRSTTKSSTQKLEAAAPRRDSKPQPRCHGPDPTVPHLKYGLFPKKNRGQSRILGSKPIQESDSSEIKKPKARTPKEDETAEPLFVVRALDSRLTRRLSRAASTHLDIKPRSVK